MAFINKQRVSSVSIGLFLAIDSDMSSYFKPYLVRHAKNAFKIFTALAAFVKYANLCPTAATAETRRFPDRVDGLV